MNDTLRNVKRPIGVVLILLATAVGILWYFTRDPTLDPLCFVLATAGSLLVL
jgi:hypothetical protein